MSNSNKLKISVSFCNRKLLVSLKSRKQMPRNIQTHGQYQIHILISCWGLEGRFTIILVTDSMPYYNIIMLSKIYKFINDLPVSWSLKTLVEGLIIRWWSHPRSLTVPLNSWRSLVHSLVVGRRRYIWPHLHSHHLENKNIASSLTALQQGFFQVFWEHGPYQ